MKDEYTNYSGGDDRVDTLWLFVEDEADADTMSTEYRLSRLRCPYIAGDETAWMLAHQYV